MIAGCSAVEGPESFVTQDTYCFVVGGTEWSVAGAVEYFGGIFLFGPAYHCSSPLHVLPHSFKWGNAVPMSISL